MIFITTIIFSPFIVLGFLFQETKRAISAGITLSELFWELE